MTPINGILYGLLFSTCSRIAGGELDLAEDTVERMEVARDKLEEFSNLVGDLAPDKPGTWSRFAGRLMERTFDTRKRFESVRQALQASGFDARCEIPTDVARTIAEELDDDGEHILFRDDETELVLLYPSQELSICAEFTSSRGDTSRLYFQKSRATRNDVHRVLGDILWKRRTALYLGTTKGKLSVRDLDISQFVYHGDRLQLVEEWQAFRRRGIRRNVLLQGPPGCGKTTLCAHAARELGERVILVEPELLAQSSLMEWTELLAILSPDVLIVDDIDRLADLRGSDLEQKLAFFEEGTCDIPFVLFTSNDYTRIPAAMRRPGRIDQVVRFDEPDQAVRQKIIEQLAAREEIEVPTCELPRLLELLDDYSTAHVVEALRRAHVCGWESSRQGDDAFRLQREYRSPQDWLRIHGYREVQIEATFIFIEIISRTTLELAYEDERNRLYRVLLPNGASLCIEKHERWGIAQVYYRHDIDGPEGFRQGIAELFWQDRKAILIDAVEHDHQTCQKIQLSAHDYHGPMLANIDQWRTFAQMGYRRNVLLQGPPGCGKSTFCMHAARELSNRTLIFTPEYCGTLRCGTWQNIIEYLNPEMLIIDDVDRVNEHSLETNLRLFEEGFCEVPFVFFTTNDHNKLPRPMRRPGRIDQIIEVEAPTQKLRWQLIDEMAARESIDQIPDEHLRRLDNILVRQSTAHLVEALRRARVLGWDEAYGGAGDITFDEALVEVSEELAAG